MWPIYLYLAFIPVCWIVGWLYVLHRKYRGVPANQVLDAEGIAIFTIFCSLVWPASLALFAFVYLGKIVWNFGGRMQDRLVEYLKRPKPNPPLVYGESKGYRQPPEVI